MKRTVFAVAALLVGAATARADTIPLIENLSLPVVDGVPQYTPGQSFTFTVGVPTVADFSGYSVELIFTALGGDPALSVDAARATTNYPFPGSSAFAAPSGPGSSPNQVVLTISDTKAPTDTVPAGAYTLATVTVTPDSTLTGAIFVSLGRSQFDINPEGSLNLQPPDPFLIEQGEAVEPPPATVPAPPALGLAGAGVLLLAARARFTRRACAASRSTPPGCDRPPSLPSTC